MSFSGKGEARVPRMTPILAGNDICESQLAMTFTHRVATEADLPAIRALMDVAIVEHLKAFLDPAQVELSKSIMGLDTQLIADRTYFLVEEDGCHVRKHVRRADRVRLEVDVPLRAWVPRRAVTKHRERVVGLGAGFPVKISSCEAGWCAVSASDHPPGGPVTTYSGYLPEGDLWGVYRGESFD